MAIQVIMNTSRSSMHPDEAYKRRNSFVDRRAPRQSLLLARPQQTASYLSTSSHTKVRPISREINDALLFDRIDISHFSELHRPSKETFPIFLHKLLDRIELDGYSEVVSWSSSGMSFCIHDRDRFIDTIMPRYFPHQHHLKSFFRQLSLYGFQRVKKPQGSSPSSSCYAHPEFRRDDLARCYRMERKRTYSSASHRKSSSDSDTTLRSSSGSSKPRRVVSRDMLEYKKNTKDQDENKNDTFDDVEPTPVLDFDMAFGKRFFPIPEYSSSYSEPYSYRL